MTEPQTNNFEQRYDEISAELADKFPDRCAAPRPCSTVGVIVGGLALDVITGEISREVAAEQADEQAKRIAKDCTYGQEEVGGCFGGTKCNMASYADSLES